MSYFVLHHFQTVLLPQILFLICCVLSIFAVELSAKEHRHLRQEQIPSSYSTLQEWLVEAEDLRARILVSAGLEPMPAKTPLNPQISERIFRDGYTVQNVTLETLPGFYVTGNLYRPVGHNSPRPAILSPHGHWSNGRFENSEKSSVPGRAIHMARCGAVVFTYSMIGYNELKSFFPHRFDEPHYQLWGFGSLGLQLWNSLRALDFLTSLSEVDVNRIGVTGASGGGTQTFLLGAVDSRVAVAAPVNMISAHFQGGCICENAPLLRLDLTNVEIGALMAPRPLLLVSTSGDWTAKTPAVEYPAIRSIYRLFGNVKRVTNAHFDYPHNYNQDSREAVYDWLGMWLSDAGWSPEKSFQVESEVTLRASLPSSPLPIGEIFLNFAARARGQIELYKPRDANEIFQYRKKFGEILRHTLSSKASRDQFEMEFLLPVGQNQSGRSVLVVHTVESEHRVQKIIHQFHEEDWLVFKFCLDPVANELKSLRKIDYWTTYNTSPSVQQIAQIQLACREILGRDDVKTLDLVGLGKAGALVLLGAATGPPIRRVVADLDGFSVDSDLAFLNQLNIPLIRRAGDLKTAAVLLVPTQLVLHGLEKGPLKQWLRDIYQVADSSKKLEFRTSSIEEVDGENFQ